MKAILPVAGEAKRLRPHSFTIAKALMNVGGKPIVAHILDELKRIGIRDIIMIIGYKGDQIKEWATETYPDMKFYFPVQTERKGLAHAILMGEPFMGENEPLLIVLGDTIFEGDIGSALKTEADGALGVKRVDDPRRFGVIETDEKGKIVKLIEKPSFLKPMMALVGLNYIKNTKLMFKCIKELIANDIKTKGEYQITDAFQLMVDEGATLVPFEMQGWYDCGTRETLLATNKHLLETSSNYYKERENCIIIPPVFINDEAEIENSIIGPYVTIDKRAAIKNSIIRNSIINQGAKIDSEALQDSLVGDNAKVKGSLKVINIGDSSELSFDGGEIDF